MTHPPDDPKSPRSEGMAKMEEICGFSVDPEETVIHLAHYVGWPRSTGLNEVAERVIARRHPTDAS